MDLFVLYFLFKMYMPIKKYLGKKVKKLCLIVQILIESQFFGILTEPLNRRDSGRQLYQHNEVDFFKTQNYNQLKRSFFD